MNNSSANPQGRKWLLTINNPQAYGFNHDRIIDALQLSNPAYFCLGDEIGETGTYHTHVYVFSPSPIRFNTLKNRFPIAHIEKAYGTSAANRDYITKSGKWEETKKAETIVEGTFFEYGQLPSPAVEACPTKAELLELLDQGLSTEEIIRSHPQYAFQVKNIDLLRETLKHEKFRKEKRPVHVIYLFGASGAGKTRSVYDAHGAENVCRITDYSGPNGVRFDAYHGQEVLVFEEFHSQIPIENMLNYLDIYPLMLPARYSDRVACYTTVYITSNISLEEQYEDIQRRKMETWRAFLRRIHTVREFQHDGTVVEKNNGKRPKL